MCSKFYSRDPQSTGSSHEAQHFKIDFAYWFIWKLSLILTLTQLYLFPLVLTSLSLECGVKVVTSRKWIISPEFLVLNINLAMIWMASASARWWNSLRNQICSHTPRKHPKLHRNTWHRKHRGVSVPNWHMEVGATVVRLCLTLDCFSAVVVTLTLSPFIVVLPVSIFTSWLRNKGRLIII